MSLTRFTPRADVYLFLFKENKILLLRRYKTGWMDGKYSLIAGHFDGNETVSDAIIREAFEEAQIRVSQKNLLPATVLHRKSSDEEYEYIDFFFIAKKWKGEPSIGEPDKCDELKWFSLDHLPDTLLPYVREALHNYKNKKAFSESGWR